MKFEETPTSNGHTHTSIWEPRSIIKDLEIGDDHIGTSMDTPLRPDAFVLSDQQKMVRIEKHFREIMETLGLDLTDDSLRGTPRRVAKMYVEEFFSGLDPANKPSISLFDNKFGYHQMLVEKNITLHSHCEHHFVPITGVVHIAYIPKGKVIGLSKLNRIARYYAKRPQVQERLTMQIAHDLQEILGTQDVAVMVDAVHHCVCSRGIEDQGSSTITAEYGGKFLETRTRDEFLRHIG
ncbi:MAG: GTP cyclohydrolase I FolE [Saprospiraceae bacterium]|nr:GTP cyclohydrolase I FolE [Saprospiraceae bacterium]MCB9312397.1 GTP cyclohydrolase I FolE [Lewinellaceae bacterium]HRW76102.1 GTP cyclohydrolase I FolE [Saprospiraceae bacterium]